MASQQNVRKAIDVLKDADAAIKELLNDSPELLLHGSSVLKRLMNGYAHAVGISIEEAPALKEEKVTLTHICGIPVTAKEQVKTSEAIPSNDEEAQLNEIVSMAFDEFTDMDAPTIIETYNELIIRGVAVKAGIEVTATTPAIDVAFIEQIKEAIVKINEAKAPNEPEVVKPPKLKK